jgi:hypothetical protein
MQTTITSFCFNHSECIDQRGLAERELGTLDNESMDKCWNLQNYFGHAKVISMNTESPRFKRCEMELASVGLKRQDYEIAEGIDGATLPKELYRRMVSWDIRRGLLKDDALEKRKMGQTGCYWAQYDAIRKTSFLYEKAKGHLQALRANPQSTEAALNEAICAVRRL